MENSTSQLRQRLQQEMPEPDAGAGFTPRDRQKKDEHPSGRSGAGGPKQLLNVVLLVSFILSGIICAHTMQLVGSLTYFINKNWFYDYMSFTKQQFGLITNSITRWFSPIRVRISGDTSMKGQLKLDKNGKLKTSFPDRLVMVANHQIYTDWLYLWWIAYTGRMHGHIFIILKESLKYIPLIGPGMMFYGFIFLARNWAKDKERFHYRLQKLNSSHKGAMAGKNELDPMWLVIFPEGTNLCPNGRKASVKWATKQGIPDMQHQLLPRTTGLQFCLQELRNTVEWVYDCTITYEGIPRGQYGQDIFTLRSTYFQGRFPKSVNMYWRRFHISTIPFDDNAAFDIWLRQRWSEKDELMERYYQNERFPADESGGAGPSGYLETAVESKDYEWLLIYAPVVPFFLLLYGLFVLAKWYR